MEKRFKERKDRLETKRTKEKEFLVLQNEHLKKFLMSLEDNDDKL